MRCMKVAHRNIFPKGYKCLADAEPAQQDPVLWQQ